LAGNETSESCVHVQHPAIVSVHLPSFESKRDAFVLASENSVVKSSAVVNILMFFSAVIKLLCIYCRLSELDVLTCLSSRRTKTSSCLLAALLLLDSIRHWSKRLASYIPVRLCQWIY